MVNPRPMTVDFAVSPQIAEADFSALALAGYKTIINNRPDGEEVGQLTAEMAQQLAEAIRNAHLGKSTLAPEAAQTLINNTIRLVRLLLQSYKRYPRYYSISNYCYSCFLYRA